MRRAFWHSRDFQRYFFTYAILFFCMLLAGAVVVVLATQAERQQAADQLRTAQGKRIAEVVDNAWDSAIEAGNFLRSSTWVQKYMSETDVFAQEFGPLRQREFSQSLTALCASTDLIRGISIWYPQKDIVVSSAGWFSSEEYEAYAARKFQTPDGFLADYVLQREKAFGPLLSNEFAFSNTGYLVYIQQMDILAAPRALTMVFIDKAALQKLLGRVCGEQVAGFVLTGTEDRTYLVYGRAADEAGFYKEVFPSQNMMLNYTLFFRPAVTPLTENLGGAVILIALSLAGVFLAYGLASFQYSPLNRLIRKASERARQKAPLDGGIDTIEACVDKLYDDNETLEHTLASYRHALRDQTNAQLLKGYFTEDVSEELHLHDIPFTYQYWYIVLVFRQQQEDGLSAPEDAQRQIRLLVTLKQALQHTQCGQMHCELVENIEGHVAVIAEFSRAPGDEAAVDLGETLYDALAGQELECSVFAARPRKGLMGISVAYQEAKETMQEQPAKFGVTLARPSAQYYYPLDWESQLIRAMREGNAKLAQAILRQLYEENAALHLSHTLIQRVATLLYETMRRIIFEAKLPAETFLEIEEPQYAGSLTQVFRMAERAALCICEQTLRKKEAASVGINQSLVEYVDENVFDPELSLNMLSDIFGVSNASISRLFKNATGDTFYNYITDRRMRRAQELLRLRGYSPKGMAAEVGYDNEYSFKRAFVRQYGITPKEYAERESQHEANISSPG